MKNRELPVQALTGDAYTDIMGTNMSEGRYEDGMGLTKREYAAIKAMQGLCANSIPDNHNRPKVLAKDAVMVANALFDELESNNEQL